MLPLQSNPQVEAGAKPPSWLRALTFCYKSRRKIATCAAFALAVGIGSHAILGSNGLVAYSAKRKQESDLARRIDAVRLENARLEEHNARLQQDPHAIEGAIRQRLRYAKPNEVILQVDEQAAKQ